MFADVVRIACVAAAILTVVDAAPTGKTVVIAPGVTMPSVSLGTCCGSDPKVGLLPWLKVMSDMSFSSPGPIRRHTPPFSMCVLQYTPHALLGLGRRRRHRHRAGLQGPARDLLSAHLPAYGCPTPTPGVDISSASHAHAHANSNCTRSRIWS